MDTAIGIHVEVDRAPVHAQHEERIAPSRLERPGPFHGFEARWALPVGELSHAVRITEGLGSKMPEERALPIHHLERVIARTIQVVRVTHHEAGSGELLLWGGKPHLEQWRAATEQHGERARHQHWYSSPP
jgi:hypothetical protein